MSEKRSQSILAEFLKDVDFVGAGLKLDMVSHIVAVTYDRKNASLTDYLGIGPAVEGQTGLLNDLCAGMII